MVTKTDLERQFTALSLRIVTKQLRLESRGFRYKVALYFTYLHIEFDNDIKWIIFEYQA